MQWPQGGAALADHMGGPPAVAYWQDSVTQQAKYTDCLICWQSPDVDIITLLYSQPGLS